MRHRPFVLATVTLPILVILIGITWVQLIRGEPACVPPLPPVIHNGTGIHSVPVEKVVVPGSVEEIQEIVRSHRGPISLGGARFSQGGQTAHPETLHLDLRRLNRVLALDPRTQTITVECGATWRQIQQQIDPIGLSVRIMQTYANFTVGGSLSVNVHGRYIGEGPIIRSVQSLRIVLADGSIQTASEEVNPDLFHAAIGGYGGIGIITDATLRLTENVAVERHSVALPIATYPEHFNTSVRDNPDAIFSNGDIYPPDFEIVRAVTWYKSARPPTSNQRLRPIGQTDHLSPRIIALLAESDTAKKIRRVAIEPLLHLSKPVVWRNNEASYDVSELPAFTHQDHTYGLREYFIPVKNFSPFVERMRSVFSKHNVNIINVSIRHALPDSGSFLAWAREEVFAFVVYYRQGITPADQERVRVWTRAMIDEANAFGGSFYLPYQVYESPEQRRRAYPQLDSFLAAKRRFDPNNTFRNTLIDSITNPDQRPDLNAIPNYRQSASTPLIHAAESWINLHEQVSSQKERRTSRIKQLWRVCESGIAAANHHGFPGTVSVNQLRQTAWLSSLRTLLTPLPLKARPAPTPPPDRTHLLLRKTKNLSLPESTSVVLESEESLVLSTPQSILPRTLSQLAKSQTPVEEIDGLRFATLCLVSPRSEPSPTLPPSAVCLFPSLSDPVSGQHFHYVHTPLKLLPVLLGKHHSIQSVFH